MTIREIADVAGVSIDTASRKAKELFPVRFQQGKRTDLTQREGIEVMKGLRKLNMVSLPQSAEVLPRSAEVAVGSTLTERDLQVIGTIVAAVMAGLDGRVQKIESRVEERQALLPGPKMADKDAIRQLVAREASRSGREHSKVWNELYDRCYYLHLGNFKVQAKNNGAKSVIDYIDAKGMSGDVLAVALDLWK
jgi:hypothetical protein